MKDQRIMKRASARDPKQKKLKVKMASIMINCLVVWCKTSDYHGVWFHVPCLSDDFQFSYLSFCALVLLIAGNRCTRLFITEVQIRFPFARNRDDCRSNSDLLRRRSGNKAIFLPHVISKWGEETDRFKASSKGFGKENCLLFLSRFGMISYTEDLYRTPL